MDPVIIVSGKWVKRHRYVFETDNRGCRVLHLKEETEFTDLVKMVMEDFGLETLRYKIQLSYMFSSKTMKNMSHDTPPVFVCNSRQLQGFLNLKKIDHIRLCVEITSTEDGEYKDRGTNKRPIRHVSKEEVTFNVSYDEGKVGGEKNSSSNEDNMDYKGAEKYEDEYEKVFDEDEQVFKEDEEEEDDEFSFRFDAFDDPDGATSDDENFSLYGKPPKEDDYSPNLPPKKRPHNIEATESKGNKEFLKVEMTSLNLAVGQRYNSKKKMEIRLKLLTLRDRFDFDVPISNSETLVAKCWVDGCSWRVRASTQGKSPEFYIRIYDSEHSCSVTERSNRSRQATPDILGVLYRDFLGDIDPSVKPRHVGVTITKQFGIKVTADLFQVATDLI